MPDMEPHVRRGHPIVFGLILLFSLIEGCITAWLVSQFNSDDNYPNNSYRDRIRFLLFVSWWTVVFSAGYLAFFLINAGSFLVSIASHGIWLAITWFFWLIGAAVYSATLSGRNCGGSDLIHCNQLVATEAFAWITWILMTLAFVVIALLGMGAVRRGDTLSNGLV